MATKKTNVGKVSVFEWTAEKSRTAILLAEGNTQKYVAEAIGKNVRTVERWLTDIEFSAEVDRLSVMTGIASKAERLRIAKRVIRQKTMDGIIKTDKDILEWLKFAQGETDGVKLDLAALRAAFGEDGSPVA